VSLFSSPPLFFNRFFSHEQPAAVANIDPSASALTDPMLYLPKPNGGLPGRDQLLLKSPELQRRLGQQYCDESEQLPLLLSYGLWWARNGKL
jgi:hypothetical protein